jgi:hypothetical protein
MRATDDRYRTEQAKFDLAMRMIRHEARTGTIRYWTGLNDDRIRKLYTTYFKYAEAPVRRRRGRSPTRVGPLVRTPVRALESGLFANLLLANGLFSIEQPPGPNLKGNSELGHRFCECFETYDSLVPRGLLSFEWAGIFCSALARRRLGIARCETCSICYVSTCCRCRARRARRACCSSSATRAALSLPPRDSTVCPRGRGVWRPLSAARRSQP